MSIIYSFHFLRNWLIHFQLINIIKLKKKFKKIKHIIKLTQTIKRKSRKKYQI